VLTVLSATCNPGLIPVAVELVHVIVLNRRVAPRTRSFTVQWTMRETHESNLFGIESIGAVFAENGIDLF